MNSNLKTAGKILLAPAKWAFQAQTTKGKLVRCVLALALYQSPFVLLSPSTYSTKQVEVSPSYSPAPVESITPASPSAVKNKSVEWSQPKQVKPSEEPMPVETPQVREETPVTQRSSSGRCDYPDDIDVRGRRCGKRAASEKAGGR